MRELVPALPQMMRPGPQRRYRLRDRLRARFLTAALDRALADGAPGNASPALELRAKALARPSVASELADQLRVIVRRAQGRAPAGRPHRGVP